MKTSSKQQITTTSKNSLVKVDVLLPANFVKKFSRIAEASNITLAEAIRYVAEAILPQQFATKDALEGDREGDPGLEMCMLRHVLGTRQKETCA